MNINNIETNDGSPKRVYKDDLLVISNAEVRKNLIKKILQRRKSALLSAVKEGNQTSIPQEGLLVSMTSATYTY
jgi:hypothetical protein